MDKKTLDQLGAAAQAGDAAAQFSLAELFASAGLAQEARFWMQRAAAAGAPAALWRLGLWEIAGFGGPQDATAGVERIGRAAEAGNAEAMHALAVLHCGGIGVRWDLPEALRWLQRAATAGHPGAATQIGLLTRNEPSASEANRFEIVQSADLSWYGRVPERRTELASPHIEVLPDFLPGWLCKYVIARAAPALARGRIVDDTGGESVSAVRSNRVMSFGLADSDVLLELINLRVAAAVGLPPENAEGLGVLHYQPGETYAPHVDFIPDTPANAAHLAARGQRARTLLVYLNEDFEEGETEFPILGRRFRPPKGAALIFHSVDEHGAVDRRTVHSGRSPVNGEKWVISKWFRTRPLRPGPPAR